MHKRRKYIVFINLFLLFILYDNFEAFGYGDVDETCTLAEHDIQGSCYLASDFGFSTGVLKVDSRSKKWVKFDPILYTKGNKTLETQANNIALKIQGGWRPWGNFSMVGHCIFDDCNRSRAEGCYTDGKEVDIGAKQVNIPCCIDNGYGLYGLIAIDKQGGPKDPNDAGDNLSPDDFFTFRVAPLSTRDFKESTSEDDQSKEVTVKTFTLDHIDIWDIASQKFTKKPIPSGGILYFKIVDTYYKDNQGGYNIVITNGGYIKKKGFAEKLMDFLQIPFIKYQT